MTIRHLRIFRTVCDCGGVTAAAERLYLSQPAVSLAVKELEQHYGTRLFDRIGKKFYRTDAGERLYRAAVMMLSQFDEMEESLRDGDRLGVLRVGSSITIGTHLLPTLVRRFDALHKNVRVHVTINATQLIEGMLLQNELDFALVEGIVRSPHLLSEPFEDDRLVCVCPPQSPLAGGLLTPEAFSAQTFLLRERGSGTRALFDAVLESAGLAACPIWESASTQALIRAVSEGLGVSVLPALFVRHALDAGLVASFKVPALSFARKFSIVRHKDKYQSAAAQAFMALVVAARSPDPE